MVESVVVIAGELEKRVLLCCIQMGQVLFCVFFFQAEDGIRDLTVTGVQTCALPISTRRRTRRPARSRWRSDRSVKITFLAPHVRIAGGVRAILAYADRLAGRGHDVTLVVPAPSRVRAAWRNVRGVGPDWVPELRARVHWVGRWTPEALAQGDVVVATAWQSAAAVTAAPAQCGAKFYFVQHYESLYHGAPDALHATYRLPLRKIVISTWLRDLLRERFGSPAEVLVTPVDPELFHPTPTAVASRPRVLMLHHEYAWTGVA